MQRCNGGPRLMMPSYTDEQIKARENKHYRHFRRHIETAKAFERNPLRLAGRIRSLFERFFGDSDPTPRKGGAVR